jgi:hypothetical protein
MPIGTRVQHLEPEGYPVRRNVCVWLLNKAAESKNFISWVRDVPTFVWSYVR